ncbi:MAG TPA: hypothetical protein VMM54_12215 [Nitrospirota bacterium]|nr:hypothetical protein [Nitrospirota bacterium]
MQRNNTSGVPDCGVMTTTIFGGKFLDNDIEQIRSIINAVAVRYQAQGGDIRFAGVEGGVVKIVPTGFCWR